MSLHLRTRDQSSTVSHKENAPAGEEEAAGARFQASADALTEKYYAANLIGLLWLMHVKRASIRNGM